MPIVNGFDTTAKMSPPFSTMTSSSPALTAASAANCAMAPATAAIGPTPTSMPARHMRMAISGASSNGRNGASDVLNSGWRTM